MQCSRCGKENADSRPSIGTGYGIDQQGNKVCYDCCGEEDRSSLANAKIGDKFCLYLTGVETGVGGNGTISNWPGTYKKNVWVKVGRHNICRNRYDCWFKENNKEFHGVRFGDDTEICHIKCIKNG